MIACGALRAATISCAINDRTPARSRSSVGSARDATRGATISRITFIGRTPCTRCTRWCGLTPHRPDRSTQPAPSHRRHCVVLPAAAAGQCGRTGRVSSIVDPAVCQSRLATAAIEGRVKIETAAAVAVAVARTVQQPKTITATYHDRQCYCCAYISNAASPVLYVSRLTAPSARPISATQRDGPSPQRPDAECPARGDGGDECTLQRTLMRLATRTTRLRGTRNSCSSYCRCVLLVSCRARAHPTTVDAGGTTSSVPDRRRAPPPVGRAYASPLPLFPLPIARSGCLGGRSVYCTPQRLHRRRRPSTQTCRIRALRSRRGSSQTAWSSTVKSAR